MANARCNGNTDDVIEGNVAEGVCDYTAHEADVLHRMDPGDW